MRFDPKLISQAEAPLDASGEIDLPDDLLELAAQLSDDAAYLAECYPAERTAEVVVAAPAVRPMPRMAAGWVACGTVVLALVVVGVTYRPTSERLLPEVPIADLAPASASAVPRDLGHIPVVSLLESLEFPTVPGSGRIGRLPWAPIPAVGDVSGPELEGLLDLWQNDEYPPETRISI